MTTKIEEEPQTGETALVPIPGTDGVTVRSERVTEERFEPDDDAAGARVVAMVAVKAYGIRDASNGATIAANLEVDPTYAVDFEEMIGESTFIFKVGKRVYGECRITAVATKADPDNRPRTRVSLVWSSDQRKVTKELGDLVGTTARLELFQVQLEVFGAKSEE